MFAALPSGVGMANEETASGRDDDEGIVIAGDDIGVASGVSSPISTLSSENSIERRIGALDINIEGNPLPPLVARH